MEKRYQVFVSSTFRDLQDERQEVMHALLELDCIPSGMELFPAANETQWELIKRVIDDCDYYLLILGGRYGSIGPDGVSYTEMEYNYACSIGKPTVAFLHKSPGKIESDKSENTDDGRKLLTEFREKIGEKHCKYWESALELGSVVSRSLIQLIKREPAVGWVRANELADREATMELLSLRKQVDQLKNELLLVRTSAPQGTEGLSQGEKRHTVRYAFKSTVGSSYQWSNWTASLNLSWNDMFSYIAPSMINESPSHQIVSLLSEWIGEMAISGLKEDDRLRESEVGHFSIKVDDYQTIMVQLRALGLIIKSVKNRSVKDTETYWTLTPYGDEIMTRLRAIKNNEEDVADDGIAENNEDEG